ncbi:alpha/beta hydrolase [Microbacterium betulae]|uniref:Alpha/beta hydrolase n=1 Tax=Microbacterium betulae TaxID=2981139 RepID=A0AA97FJ34_9MICO|nr:alpha/beta hydrolase [Microbacterium sp. AB]WOF23210.1 alpha/beta hydrolase [Microbacterium sp. AB]
MSLLTTPAVANAIARLIQRGPGPRIRAEIAFAELSAETRSLTVPTRHGDVGATLYLPAEPASSPPALYVNFHGGGYVIRHPEQDDPLCRYLAAHAGVAVLNVDYDVAPGHPFPVAVEEAYDAVVWAAGRDGTWDGSRIVVGGQSAGGGLAAAVARQALEHGSPALALQVLHYPPLDVTTPGDEKHAAGRSIISVPLTRIFDTAYAPRPDQKRHRLASPAWGANADGIEGIAPALVITCGLDRLHDEGVRYADRLREAGALAEHVDLRGVDHGYSIMGSDRATVERSYRLIAGHVRRAARPGDAGHA